MKYSIVILLVGFISFVAVPYLLSKFLDEKKKVFSFEKWGLVITIIIFNTAPLLTLGTIKQHPELSTFIEIRDQVSSSGYDSFLVNGVGSTLLIIISLAIGPVIYLSKCKSDLFDVLKPIVTMFSTIATIVLFLVKTLLDSKNSIALPNNNFWYEFYHLVFGVYPLTLAVALGEYFMKLKKFKGSKNVAKGKKRPKKIVKPKWR